VAAEVAAAIDGQHDGQYAVVQLAFGAASPANVGILLLDPAADRLHLRFRRDWQELVDEDNVEVVQQLADDLLAKSQELGAEALLQYLESCAGNTVLISDREPVVVEDFEAAANRLYRTHVTPKVLAFRTHLPKYSLRAAAGKFGEHMEAEPEDWEEIPEGLRLTDEMFVAHVAGRSMEPRIPDGSLCVFRYNVVGSRTGRLVLVENYGEPGENRYTIKRYRREGQRVILEPLNPEFEAWELDENASIRVLAEFVQVLAT
jgi:SOS-response transcriptional repressor LexA